MHPTYYKIMINCSTDLQKDEKLSYRKADLGRLLKKIFLKKVDQPWDTAITLALHATPI